MTMIVIISLVGTLIAAPLVPALVGRFARKRSPAGPGPGGGWFHLAVPVTYYQPWHDLLSLSLGSVGVMMSMTVMWALEADTVWEYGEWKTGIRIEGLTYSFFSFTRKCGQALGGSIPAFLLAGSGYIPNAATQSENALQGIQQAIALVPAAASPSPLS